MFCPSFPLPPQSAHPWAVRLLWAPCPQGTAERERERVVTAPREVPACSLELTSPQPRMVLGCAHSPGGTAAPSEPLLCYVRTCTESVPRRAGGSHLPSAFWSQVFHRSVCRDTEGPGRVGCLHLGVVSFLLLWMSPEVLGLGPLPAGSVRDLVAPFNSLDLRCCPQGTATTVKSCIRTWVAGWDLAWVSPPPSLLSLSCPSQSPHSTSHQGWSSQPYLLSVSPVCLWGLGLFCSRCMSRTLIGSSPISHSVVFPEWMSEGWVI